MIFSLQQPSNPLLTSLLFFWKAWIAITFAFQTKDHERGWEFANKRLDFLLVRPLQVDVA